MARIKVLGHLAEVAGFREKFFKPEKGTRIKDIIKLEGVNMERVVVMVNQDAGSWDHEIQEDDDIVILPVIGGG